MISAPAPSPRRAAFARGVALLALAIVAAGAFFLYRDYFQTYHLATVADRVLYRDGAHSIREMGNAVRRVHPRTVVSLVDARELADPTRPQLARERAMLAERHVRLVSIPVKLGGWPTADDVRQFLRIVNDPANQPVLVHCAQGVRRTGMFVAAWQMTDERLTREQAKSAILSFGHGAGTVNDIRRFIDAWNPDREDLARIDSTGGGK